MNVSAENSSRLTLKRSDCTALFSLSLENKAPFLSLDLIVNKVEAVFFCGTVWKELSVFLESSGCRFPEICPVFMFLFCFLHPWISSWTKVQQLLCFWASSASKDQIFVEAKAVYRNHPRALMDVYRLCAVWFVFFSYFCRKMWINGDPLSPC